MREIKFRGKAKNRKDTWFYGDLRRADGITWIFPSDEDAGYDKHQVFPETIGQFTGLKDRNDVEIFEGDIFKFGIYQYLIVFNNGGFGYKTPEKFVGFSEIKDLKYFFSEMEVIGNIHKNSELLVR